MQVTKDMLNVNDVSVGEFSDYDAVFFSVSKETCKKLFSQINREPKDEYGEINKNFAEGEIQIMIDRESQLPRP